MKYICKQKLPFCDVGEEVTLIKVQVRNNEKPAEYNFRNWCIQKDGTAFNSISWPFEWEDIFDWFEPKRWRAELKAFYWALELSRKDCIYHFIDTGSTMHDQNYTRYNYFQTKEQAEKARLLVLEALKKAHE